MLFVDLWMKEIAICFWYTKTHPEANLSTCGWLLLCSTICEPTTTFLFRAYNPYFWWLKPPFFTVLRSEGRNNLKFRILFHGPKCLNEYTLTQSTFVFCLFAINCIEMSIWKSPDLKHVVPATRLINELLPTITKYLKYTTSTRVVC